MAGEWYTSHVRVSNLNLPSSKRNPYRGFERMLADSDAGRAVLLLIRVDQRLSAVRVFVFNGR
jgi:hypothetical protein